MLRSDIIQKMADTLEHFPAKDVEMGVHEMLDCMTDWLARGQRIEIRGFGSLKSHVRHARKAHNPKTGAAVFTTDTRAPYFRQGKAMKKRVNQS